MHAVRGVVHVVWGDANKKANLVPADYCVNAMISAAWDINRRYVLITNNMKSIKFHQI